jgi:hypothetical protein
MNISVYYRSQAALSVDLEAETITAVTRPLARSSRGREHTGGQLALPPAGV